MVGSKTHLFCEFLCFEGFRKTRNTQSLPGGTGVNPISEPDRTARLATLEQGPTMKCECCDLVALHSYANLAKFTFARRNQFSSGKRRVMALTGLVTVPVAKHLDLPEQKKKNPQINQC